MPDSPHFGNRIRWTLLVLSWAILAAMAAHFFLGRKGYRSTLKLHEQIQQLKEMNQDVARENSDLEKETHYRKTDAFLEEIARTELGYGKPGERIIRWALMTPTPIPHPESTATFPAATNESR
jgi:cell division protein FtsB